MNFREFFITNTWWGKILGAFFGYLIGGAAGALFGILVGNLFDRGLSSHFANPHWFYFAEKRKMVQKIFFEATFGVMGHIAKADGRVSEQEIKIAKILMNEMRLSTEQKAKAKRLYNEGKQSDFKLDLILNQLVVACRDNRELLKLFVEIQYRAAQVDGLSDKKIQALDTIFSRLGFAPLHKQNRFYEDFDYHESQYKQQSGQHKQQSSSNQRYTNRPQTELAMAFAILEMPPEANKQEVKRAYRRLLSKNHPDKLISQGLPQEMIKMANDKTQKIVKAYETICRNKGW